MGALAGLMMEVPGLHRIWLAVALGCVAWVGGVTAAMAAPSVAAPPSTDFARCAALRDTDPTAAVELVDTVLARGAMAHDDEMKLQSCLARAASVLNDNRRVIAAVDRIETLLLAHPMPPAFELRALSNAGAALQMIGQTPRALDLHIRAYDAARLEASEDAQAATLINVGIIYSEELEAHETAERFFQQARTLTSAADSFKQNLHYNVGMNHLRAGRDRSALASFKASEALGGDEDDYSRRRIRSEIVALGARLAITDTTAAQAALRRMVDVQIESGDPAGASITLLRLSQIALDAGHSERARNDAERAIALNAETPQRIEHRDAVRARIAALRAAGRFEMALDAQSGLIGSELRTLRAQNLDSLAGLQAKMLDRDREREVLQLREAQQIEALALLHTRWLRNAATLCALALAVLMLAFWWYQRRVNRRLHHLGSADALTGLENRGAAMRRLGATPLPVRPALRNAVFLIDVDHFKQCNDRYGHATGDAILVQIAARLIECCRPGDLVARWGGEEFLVACPDIELRAATEIAERLGNAVGGAPFEIDEVGAVPLSISLGFACWPFLHRGAPSVGGWQDAVGLADRALYASKRGGRAAWTGLWGGDAVTDTTIAEILRHPETAIASGAATACSSRAHIHWGAEEAEVETPLAPDHAPRP